MTKIRVCLVGGGRAGKVHAGSLREHVPGAELVALADQDPEVLRRTGDEFEIEGRHPSLERALEQADIDAVVITTPTFAHKENAVTAAEAGAHVFLEKPMALTLEECDAIIDAVERNQVLLQIGFMRRFDPEFQAAAERIEAGEIGRPMMIKSLTHGPGLPPPWARELETSNGNLAEVNSHDWDCTRWLMGSDPERVYVEVANFKGADRGVDSDDFYDNALVNIRFESGALGSISGVCPCDYGYDARVEIVGEKGIMQVGGLQSQALNVGVDRDKGLQSPIFRSWPERFQWAYIREMRHFVDCVREQKPPAVGAEDGRWAVAAVLAGTRSFQEQRPVYLKEVLEEAQPA